MSADCSSGGPDSQAAEFMRMADRMLIPTVSAALCEKSSRTHRHAHTHAHTHTHTHTHTHARAHTFFFFVYFIHFAFTPSLPSLSSPSLPSPSLSFPSLSFPLLSSPFLSPLKRTQCVCVCVCLLSISQLCHFGCSSPTSFDASP